MCSHAQFGRFSSDDTSGGSGLGGGLVLLVLVIIAFRFLDSDGRKELIGIILQIVGFISYFIALLFVAKMAQENIYPTKDGSGLGFVFIFVFILGLGLGVWLWNKLDS
jgi:hypothetical protein